MSPETLDRLCAEALQRVHYFINKSAGQHLRRMRESWAQPQPVLKPETLESEI